MSTDAGECQPLNKAVVLHSASTESVANSKAVTVLTYLHGVKESQVALEKILSENLGADMDLIELRTLKPMDMDTIRASLQRTHKVIILGVDFPRVLHLFPYVVPSISCVDTAETYEVRYNMGIS